MHTLLYTPETPQIRKEHNHWQDLKKILYGLNCKRYVNDRQHRCHKIVIKHCKLPASIPKSKNIEI